MNHKLAPPDWLKTTSLVFHVPTRTIFEPQRKVTFRNGTACLLDCCDQSYPLAQCDQLRREHFNGVARWVTEGSELTVFRLTAAGNLIAITDGTRKAIVRFPGLKPQDETRQAAQSVAQFFNGEILE